MSTSLKSASYFLQSVIDHMKAMTAKYKSFEIYLADVKRKEIEAVEFLDKIIMNRFRYEMAKKAQIDVARTTLRRNKITDIFLAVFVTVIGLATIAILAKRSDIFKADVSWTTRITIGAQAVAFLVALIALYLLYRTQMMWENEDMNAIIRSKQVGEEFFIRFNNVDAIAVYHALFLNFNYKVQTDNWEMIQKRYNTIVKGSEDPEDDEPQRQLDIMDVIKGKVAGFDWIEIIDACRPEYVLEVKNKLANTKIAEIDLETLTTQMELVELAKQEQIVRLWDNNMMSVELQAKAKSLWRIVAASTYDRETNITDIIKTQVVPLMVVDDILFLKDVVVQKPMAVVNVISKTLNTPGECMFELKISPKGVFAQFDPKTKNCVIFGEAIPAGFVLKKKKGATMFVKRQYVSDAIIFVEGTGEFPKELAAKTLTSMAKTNDCLKECLDSSSCIKLVMEPQPCSMTTGPQNMPFKYIDECDNNCALFKTSILGLAERVDAATYFNLAEVSIRDKLINLSSMYDYRMFFMPHLEKLDNELAAFYTKSEVESVMVRVTDIFIYVDDAIKKVEKSTHNLQFMTKDKFMNKIDDLSISQFLVIKDDIVGKLYRLTTTLQNNVQSDISNMASPNGGNMFVNEERSLAMQRNLLYTTFVMGSLGYIVYLVSLVSKTESIGVTNVLVKIGIPFVCMFLFLALMYAYYKKRRTEQDYNRDVLESNSSKLIQAMFVLSQSCKDIQEYFPNNTPVGTQLKNFGVPLEAKAEMYDDILLTLRMLEKCNLLTIGMDTKLPFPIVDISINIVTMFFSGVILLFLVRNISSLETINQIKSSNMIVDKVKDFPRRFTLEDFPELECEHSQAATLKMMGVVVFAVISMYFASKLLESATRYKAGLYNSRYFAELKCIKKK